MTICREWSLVKYEPDARRIRPLYCRSWTCDVCAPKRREQLMANAASGAPNRFLTLTVSPTIGSDPADRLRKLARAWRVCVQRLRRLYGKDSIDYLAIVEETKLGEPHLHILLRSVFLPQKLLSSIMGELIDSPIVDIRAIKNVQHVVRYVAKYITKAPAQFGTAKRYWSSRTWELVKFNKPKAQDPMSAPWMIEQRRWETIIIEWCNEGYAPRRDRGDTIIAILPSRSPPRAAPSPIP